MSGQSAVLDQLMAVIQDRKSNPVARAYTSTLMAGGVEKIGAKILEEAREVVEAAAEQPSPEGREHVVHEAADLVYHLCVLLGFKDVTWSEIEAELMQRAGVSGLDEKESRNE